MNKAHRKSRSGFTLLEVVVGLLLLATVLVASIMALGRHRRLVRLASDRDWAVLQADRLLRVWLESSGGVPISASARLVDRPDWIWRTSIVSNRVVFGQPLSIVRLEILQPANESHTQTALVAVETLYSSGTGISPAP